METVLVIEYPIIVVLSFLWLPHVLLTGLVKLAAILAERKNRDNFTKSVCNNMSGVLDNQITCRLIGKCVQLRN
jgi:hypothetical protein